jgi:hypothetical protein
MRFANRRFRQTLKKLKTRRLSKAKQTRRVSQTKKQKQRGGGNTLTRTIPNAAIITNPGEPIREEQDVDPEHALD